MKLGLAAWHRAMLAGCPDDLLAELLAEDAVFHSAVAHTPQEGRDKAALYMGAAGRVFANSGFAYVRELVDGPEACLEFSAEIDGVTINGVDLIRFDLEGRIVDFKVMLRGQQAIDVVWQKMTDELENT